jgi:hypothetical protein
MMAVVPTVQLEIHIVLTLFLILVYVVHKYLFFLVSASTLTP